MKLLELFDKPLPIEIDSLPGGDIGRFTINDMTYMVSFMISTTKTKMKAAEVVFSAIYTDESGNKVVAHNKTDSGNELQVFSTVVHFVKKCANVSKPDAIVFTARLGEPSRVKLYTRLASVLSKGTNYVNDPTNNKNGIFTLYRSDYNPNGKNFITKLKGKK